MDTEFDYDVSRLLRQLRHHQQDREPPELRAAREGYQASLRHLEQARAAYRAAREAHRRSKEALRARARVFWASM